MLDNKTYRETFSKLHASEDTLTEVYKVINRKTNSRRIGKRVAVIAIAAALILALSITALAYAGALGWFSPRRDEETSSKADNAQNAVTDFVNAALPGDGETPPAEGPGVQSDAAAEGGWAQYILDDSGKINVALADYACEADDGAIMYFFSSGRSESGGDISARVSAEGRVVGIDCRQAYPYPAPEGADGKYFAESCDIIDGAFVPNGKLNFLADPYLTETAYPDKAAYRRLAEPAALAAIELLYGQGLIPEGRDSADMAYFQYFNGGAAWVPVLMKNGSVYAIMLQPDDLSALGFIYFSPEKVSGITGYSKLFEALRTDTLNDYQAQLQEEFKNGLG